MSFPAYMSNLRLTGLPLGYFAQRMQEHADLPDAKTWQEVETYLVGRKADPVLVTSASEYWKDYQTSGTNLK